VELLLVGLDFGALDVEIVFEDCQLYCAVCPSDHVSYAVRYFCKVVEGPLGVLSYSLLGFEYVLVCGVDCF
jgi:hypothetical protein